MRGLLRRFAPHNGRKEGKFGMSVKEKLAMMGKRGNFANLVMINIRPPETE